MVDTFFPIMPVAEVPKPAGNYKGKGIEDWTWKDFQNYFDDKYAQKFGLKPPTYKAALRRAQIAYAVELRGKELFKAMIDYLLERPKRVEWSSISMSLILGNHGWAIDISQKAKKKIDAELDLTDEEL
jgi:hypothetical protein